MLLAREDTTTWLLVFDSEDVSLFVERTTDQTPDVSSRKTVDDFLGSVPADATHAAAIAKLTAFLIAITQPAARELVNRQ